MNSCSASEKDVRLTCFAFKIVVLRIKNPPFSQQKIWRQNGDKNLVSRFSNAEKTEFLIKKNSSNSEESEELCHAYTMDQLKVRVIELFRAIAVAVSIGIHLKCTF